MNRHSPKSSVMSDAIKQHTAECFSKAADNYGKYAKVQTKAAALLFTKLRLSNRYILDLGAGPLLHHDILAARAADVVHMDLSHAMLMQGPNMTGRVCADMDALPFQSETFDAVFSNFAIQWSQSPAQLFTELARVCKSGGQVVLSSVLTGSLNEIAVAWQANDCETHVNHFLTLSALIGYAAEAGFDIGSAKQIALVDEYPDAKAAIQSIKHIGANKLQGSREKKGLMGRKAYRKVLDGYPITDSCAPVTYQVALLELFKR
ncbi:methyltransferase domain-containing protein [Pseudoalteromonas sp. MMG013]|uniref:methyltransferase domain-containing protein n=1 Tax=Pseudoalteromonas sp. MMG013 TaxID=2822687 RepID=UPI001B386D8C|nr:methyltransferase domain-containing protein [Pseudoalteromonas sp. MMG013]MBQ4863613.1 methyltransferase domain-containing protein [Pseudoalteromonas sp. MMG013]